MKLVDKTSFTLYCIVRNVCRNLWLGEVSKCCLTKWDEYEIGGAKRSSLCDFFGAKIFYSRQQECASMEIQLFTVVQACK